MLNKSIGSLHAVPAPSAAVLGESLKLLATFGDKKSIGTLLEQMRDVQANNEQVFRDAQALMGDLIAERNALDESRKAFAVVKVEEDLSIKRRSTELSQAEARLSGRISTFTSDQAAAKASLSDKERALEDRERSIYSRELKCNEDERDLNRRDAEMDKLESDLGIRAKQLQAKENKLRAALDGG